MEKAQLIVDSLHLSIDAKADRSTTAPVPTVAAIPQSEIDTSDIPTFNKSLTSIFSVSGDHHGDQSNSPRGRRLASINYCPTASDQANNRICPNMCDKDRPRRPQGEHYSMCTLHSDTLVKTLCEK